MMRNVLACVLLTGCGTPMHSRVSESQIRVIRNSFYEVHTDTGVGTGFGNGDYIITASHVVGTNKTVHVKQYDSGILVPVEVISTNANDIAVLKGIRSHPNLLEAKPTIGRTIVSFNNVYALGGSYMTGYIAQVKEDYIIVDIQAQVGASGGGVFTPDGKLVGVISMTFNSSGHTIIVRPHNIPLLR